MDEKKATSTNAIIHAVRDHLDEVTITVKTLIGEVIARDARIKELEQRLENFTKPMESDK
jgi:hypothetical protein